MQFFLRTCDRPGRAARAVHQLLAQDPSLTICLVDDARSRPALNQHAQLPAEHLHRQARRQWVQDLCDGDFAQLSLLEWGLLGPDNADTPGAAFNTALLALAGQRGLIMDDDVLPQVAPAPGGCAVSGDPIALEVFETQSSALCVAEGRLRPLTEVLNEVPAAAVCSFGVLGDSGMRSTAAYLLRDADWVAERADLWPKISSSRSVHRAAPVANSGSQLMSTCLFVDAQALLPPVFPLFRNADGLWGRHLAEKKKPVLHMPWSVLHLPGPRRGHPDDYLHLVQPRANDLLGLLSVRELQELGAAPVEAWRGALLGPWRRHLERMAMRLDESRRQVPVSARALHHDLEAGLRAMFEASGAVPSPIDIPGRQPWKQLVEQVRLYLGLRKVWPQIWDRAQQLPFPRAISIC